MEGEARSAFTLPRLPFRLHTSIARFSCPLAAKFSWPARRNKRRTPIQALAETAYGTVTLTDVVTDTEVFTSVAMIV